MMWGTKTTESKRYYYSNDGLFEKSLDVYKPILNSDYDSNDDDDNEKRRGCDGDLPVVLLVVGSGWVGHRAFIYAQTSWWNSSGPKTIASLGCTCVCIRHRGAFCVLPSATVIGQCLVLVLATIWAVTGGCWKMAFGVTLLVALPVALLKLGGRGSASFQDMLDDVAEALAWVYNNQDLLRIQQQQQQQPIKKVLGHSKSSSSWMDTTATTELTSTTASFEEPAIESKGSNVSSDSESELVLSSPTKLSNPSNNHHHHDHHHRSHRSLKSRNSNQNQENKSPSFVFGGYSSGGHVAATLMHHPELFEKHNLPLPETLFQGVLMISGVMAVRPERVTVENTNSTTTTIIETAPGPRWLTDLVVRAVWGPEFAKKLPSPLSITGSNNTNNDNDNTPSSPPRLPHLLVGNRNELFGLSWLDVFFCSRAYCDKVRAMTGQPAKYVPVESDHWNILNSKVLHDTLQEELPKLISSS